jgi:hypothetical protein
MRSMSYSPAISDRLDGSSFGDHLPAYLLALNKEIVTFKELPENVQKAWQEACKKIIILAEVFLESNVKK